MTLVRKYDPVRYKEQCKAVVQEAKAGGRHFSTSLDKIFYPADMVKTFLKGGSPVLDLDCDDLDNEIALSVAHHVLYKDQPDIG